ncbi:MAG: TRAP transporter small permease subunit [Caldisericia bacterium]|nr:TRAP transporter small permease subunit [Caldisericia bacterium]MDD5689091.1 TRAP transporter small permease subunit [Caldisericia bacterium]
MIKKYNILIKFLDWFNVIIFFILISNIVLQVILRYFFGKPLPWGEELSRFLLVWIVFLGAIILDWEEKNLSVELGINNTLKKNKCFQLILFSFQTLFLIIVFYNGLMLINRFHRFASPGMKIPMSFLFLPVTIFAGFSTISFIIKLLNVFMFKK